MVFFFSCYFGEKSEFEYVQMFTKIERIYDEKINLKMYDINMM